ncbi:MAG TPA: hypothetical protein VF200_09085 [Woeseiaceae bacterium]
MDVGGEALTGELRVRALELPDAGLSFSDTRVRCGTIELSAAVIACRDAAVTLALPESARQTVPGEFVYERATGEFRFDVRSLVLAGGAARVRGTANTGALHVALSATALDLEALAPLAAPFAPQLAALGPSGAADLEVTLDTQGGALSGLAVTGALRGASASNEAGTLVAAGANGSFALRAERHGGHWALAAELAADGGEAYVEPVYANLAQAPVSASLAGEASADFSAFALTSLALRQGDALAVAGNLDVRLPPGPESAPLVSGTLRVEHASVEALYSGVLQVLAAGTLLGNLDTAGDVSGSVRLVDGAVAALDVFLDDVWLDDRDGRLSVAGLDGELHWPGAAGTPGDAPVTTLSWQAASAYSIPLGATSFRARLGGDDLELLAPMRIPLLGGGLRIERLSVTDFGTENAAGLVDAVLEPVQLGQLAAAFGWPAFSGTLSGRLPLLRYDGGVMTLGGSLTARAFDGDVEIANFRLEEPFGLVPKLAADLRLRKLDLELVTNTFSFGFIQGRLSGDVTGLQLVGWRPVAMDLHLYTPPDDDSRKRISQRAVENLASVGGGGAAGALSSGFMQFFEVFAYDEIGLRCVLENGVCTMSGAGPAGRDEQGGGYYIVRGRGLPRIDVVGYRSQVSWARLVAQLASIMETGGPVVR